MRIVVTGREGQVATALAEAAIERGHQLIPLARPEIDLARPDSLRAPILDALPDVIISAAAYTAVDQAESEPELAGTINAESPGVLADVAEELGVPILHLSTDYVFDGSLDRPYLESDLPSPVSVYGRTKLEGEMRIRAATDNYVILRTAWVYAPHGRNFVRTMLRLAETRDEVSVVADQRGCPTSATDIANALIAIAERVTADPSPALRGVFHLTAPDEASWAELAKAVFSGLEAQTGKKVNVRPIVTSDYPTPARRPANSRLDGAKLAHIYGIRLDSWGASLETCLSKLWLKNTD